MRKSIYPILFFILMTFTTTLHTQDKKITLLPSFKDGEIVIKKEGKASLVEMKPSFIEFSEDGKHNLFFSAIFFRINKYPTKVPLITLAFHSRAKDCKFPQDLDTKSELTIDEKSYILSNSSDKKELAKNGGGFANYNEIEGDVCNGMYMMQLPQKTFVNFATAKQVQVKIGEYKFELKRDNIKALGNMAKLLITKK